MAAGDINVVEPHARTPDNLEAPSCGEHFGVDLRGGTHEQGIRFRHRSEQLGAVWPIDPADFHPVSQCCNGGLGKLIGD